MTTTVPQSDAPSGDARDGALVAFLRLLADTPDGDVMAAAAARGLLAAWQPDLVAVYLVDDAHGSLDLVANFGLDAQQVETYGRVPLDVDIPITRLYRDGEVQFLPVAGLAEEYPILGGWAAGNPRRLTAEVTGLPLRSRGQTIGAVAVSFPDRVEKTWRLREALDALASALSVWAVGRLAVSNGRDDRRRGNGLRLSDRQRQVMTLVRDGRTNPDIAAALNVSVSTVKGDLAALFRLLGATDREDLVARADRAGL